MLIVKRNSTDGEGYNLDQKYKNKLNTKSFWCNS